MQFYPVKPTDDLDLSWEDYLEVFDLDGSEEVPAAGVSDIESGFEYRLVLHGVKTTAANYSGYHRLQLEFSFSDQPPQKKNLAMLPGGWGHEAYGIVELHNVGRAADWFFAANQFGLGTVGSNNEYNYSPYFSPSSAKEVYGIVLWAYSGSYLTGRCVLQRRRIIT